MDLNLVINHNSICHVIELNPEIKLLSRVSRRHKRLTLRLRQGQQFKKQQKQNAIRQEI